MAAATNFVKSPHPNTISKGPIQAGPTQLYVGGAVTDIWVNIPFNGVPGVTQGAGWAGKGSMGIDYTAGKAYINTGTAAAPTWTVVGTQT